MKIRGHLYALVAACTLTSCTSRGDDLAIASARSDAAMSDAAQIAAALAEAEVADRRGDMASLQRSVTKMRSLDAQPLDDTGKTQLASWEAKLPANLPPFRGRTLGAGYHSGVLKPGIDTRIEQTFLSGQKAEIAVSSAGGAELGLKIINGVAQPVCAETAQRPSCRWIPVFTQRHIIVLSNPGPKAVKFYLVIE